MMIDDHHDDCDGSECDRYGCILLGLVDPWQATAAAEKDYRDRARDALQGNP